jgi:hypothetical protein
MNSDYIVTLPSRGRRGVLVGNFILTAAHCIDCRTDGAMALGELLVIVSNFSATARDCKSMVSVPCPLYALAVWVCKKLQEFKKTYDNTR